MVFIRVGGTFQDDDSGRFIILFLSVMDFTDDHCLLCCYRTEPDDNWRSWGLPLPTPWSVPLRNICSHQIMCNGSSWSWFEFNRLKMFQHIRFNVKKMLSMVSEVKHIHCCAVRCKILFCVNWFAPDTLVTVTTTVTAHMQFIDTCRRSTACNFR